ncbi:MAG TPA: SOS response-associated peptidase [Steroidobacteraceae bacterium]|nr:SOS response-associated peptidase [Steroidobacteraceae bacterium]
MCGRYVSPDEGSIEREFNLVRTEWRFPLSFNVAPTQEVPVIRVRAGRREGVRLRWGLIPFFSRGVAPKFSTINARMETIRTAASYRGPWDRGQRCLLAACGFYEWQSQADGRTRVPYYIHLNDQEIFGFAGLWDRSHTDQGQTIESCVLITVPANRLLAEIHNTQRRMPAILAREDRDAWLRGGSPEAWSVLKPYPDEHMVAWPVSTRVNKPANNDAELITPAARSL